MTYHAQPSVSEQRPVQQFGLSSQHRDTKVSLSTRGTRRGNIASDMLSMFICSQDAMSRPNRAPADLPANDRCA
jgi:hypothetical protein